MNITVRIEAPELVAAIQALAGSLGANPSVQVMPKTEAVEPEKTEKAEKSTEPVEEEGPKPEVKTEDKPSSIKLETVRAKLAALSQSGKQTEVKQLLLKFEAKKLTEIPEEKYAELLAAAEDL
jgi:hypothetical protein